MAGKYNDGWYVEGTEYDYEISGRDGQILSADTERISTVDTTDRAGTNRYSGHSGYSRHNR